MKQQSSAVFFHVYIPFKLISVYISAEPNRRAQALYLNMTIIGIGSHQRGNTTVYILESEYADTPMTWNPVVHTYLFLLQIGLIGKKELSMQEVLAPDGRVKLREKLTHLKILQAQERLFILFPLKTQV